MILQFLYRFQTVRMILGGKWWQYWCRESGCLKWSREAVNYYLPDEDWEG